MTTPSKLRRDMTDAEAHGHDAARNAESIVRTMRDVLGYIEEYLVPRLAKGDGNGSLTAAELINDLTQRFGQVGSTYGQLIQNAAESDSAWLADKILEDR